jgi:hypothetical protein
MHGPASDPRVVLDSLAAHIAILDSSGTIVDVNRSWRRCFARRLQGLSCVGDEDRGEEAASPAGTGVGVNYLEVCRNTGGREEPFARAALAGIEDVLAGRQPEFHMTYRCAWPVEVLEFLLSVSRLPSGGAIVSHQEIPRPKAP